MRTMKRGFTLVEILIVVVILGILAAIVIPQFSQASTDSKVSSCQSNLQTIRSQIALFKIQHNDDMPPAVTTTNGTAWDEMLMYTNAAADTFSATKDVANGIIFGPYLQSVPVNPFTGLNTISATAVSGPTGGWFYDAATGTIVADDGGTTNNVAHSAY